MLDKQRSNPELVCVFVLSSPAARGALSMSALASIVISTLIGALHSWVGPFDIEFLVLYTQKVLDQEFSSVPYGNKIQHAEPCLPYLTFMKRLLHQ